MTNQANMMFEDDSDDDHSYFQQRAAWHEQRAKIATDASTRTLHRRFASLYAQRSLSRTST